MGRERQGRGDRSDVPHGGRLCLPGLEVPEGTGRVQIAMQWHGPFRPALRAFRLSSEPWLFTVDARGRIAARLEGSFGIAEFRAAVEAAL